MANIVSFTKQTVFGPDTTNVVGAAYDLATGALHDKGQRGVVQEIIAKRVIDLAGTGERDPQKLANMALRSLGISSS